MGYGRAETLSDGVIRPLIAKTAAIQQHYQLSAFFLVATYL
jgi:hypothetical protein